MSKKKKLILIGMGLSVILLFVVVYWMRSPQKVEADVIPGTVAQIALNNTFGSTTQQSLTANTATQVIGTTTCAARIITTTGADIRLSFYDGAPSLSPYNGIIQLASTTVAYNSGQYGCGVVKAYALIPAGVASSSLMFTETR